MLSPVFSVESHNWFHINITNVGILLLLLSIVSFLSYRIIYNRFFHDLRGVPGPFWGSITDFYNTYMFGTRRSHLKLLELHQRYGPIVRMAPNLLSLSDPLLLPDVYGRRVDKTPFYSTAMTGETPPLLMVQSETEHAKKLKSLSPTYAMSNIKLQETTVDECIQTTLGVFRTRFGGKGSSLDLANYIRWHTYDTVTKMIYGEATGMVEQGCEVNGLISEWHRVFRLGGLVATLPWLINPLIHHPLFKRFLMPSKRQDWGSGHIMRSHERLFGHRLRKPELARRGNIFDSLLQAKDAAGERISLQAAEYECFIFTVGAQDTTAAFMSAFVDHVLRNPAVKQRLLEEIDDFDGRGHLSFPVVRYEETTAMPYFMACCQEVLRLSPSVSMILPRYVSPGGIAVGDVTIQENVEISANPFVIHRSQNVFGQDADAFNPDRWLDDPERAQTMKKYFFAFGYGRRKCIGKPLAVFEAQKFFVQLFREFEVEYCSLDQPCRVENWGTNLYLEQYVRLTPRVLQDTTMSKDI